MPYTPRPESLPLDKVWVHLSSLFRRTLHWCAVTLPSIAFILQWNNFILLVLVPSKATVFLSTGCECSLNRYMLWALGHPCQPQNIFWGIIFCRIIIPLVPDLGAHIVLVACGGPTPCQDVLDFPSVCCLPVCQSAAGLTVKFYMHMYSSGYVIN